MGNFVNRTIDVVHYGLKGYFSLFYRVWVYTLRIGIRGFTAWLSLLKYLISSFSPKDILDDYWRHEERMEEIDQHNDFVRINDDVPSRHERKRRRELSHRSRTAERDDLRLFPLQRPLSPHFEDPHHLHQMSSSSSEAIGETFDEDDDEERKKCPRPAKSNSSSHAEVHVA